MPLHLQYRPKDFSEIVGNKTTIDSLRSVLDREDRPHAFLLTGPSGSGKTTVARIIAKEYLECDPKDINEIDAGSERGIETADKLKENMLYKPFMSENKVYIIDEIQATSKKFNDSLLKSLEDTPSHVYFILCTTDPQKLLKTVRNRCSEYVVTALSVRNLIKLIERVLEGEGVDLDDKEIRMIAEMADGCPRQALVILDQVIDVEPKDRLEVIMRSKIEEKQIIDLCKELLNQNITWDKLTVTLKLLKNAELDPETIRRSIIGYMDAVILNKDNPRAYLLNSILLNTNFYVNPRAALHVALYEFLQGG